MSLLLTNELDAGVNLFAVVDQVYDQLGEFSLTDIVSYEQPVV